jgi:hypothetical protein
VTVQDIIDRADVGDVKRRAASPTLAVFEHFAGHREVWRAMVGKRGTEVFIRHLHRFLSELIRVQLTTRAPEEETQVPPDAVWSSPSTPWSASACTGGSRTTYPTHRRRWTSCTAG